MSWFNRRPKVKEPTKLFPHHTSPFSRKKLKELKEQVTGTEPNTDIKKPVK